MRYTVCLIPDAIPSQKCHMNTGPIFNDSGYWYLTCSMWQSTQNGRKWFPTLLFYICVQLTGPCIFPQYLTGNLCWNFCKMNCQPS